VRILQRGGFDVSREMLQVWITGSKGFVGRRLVERWRAEHWAVSEWIGQAGTTSPIGMTSRRWHRLRWPFIWQRARLYPVRTPTAGVLPGQCLGDTQRPGIVPAASGRMVFVSAYVYGAPQYLPVDERHPVQPPSYTQSKLSEKSSAGPTIGTSGCRQPFSASSTSTVPTRR